MRSRDDGRHPCCHVFSHPQRGDEEVGNFRVNPRFHPTNIGWNLGSTRVSPTPTTAAKECVVRMVMAGLFSSVTWRRLMFSFISSSDPAGSSTDDDLHKPWLSPPKIKCKHHHTNWDCPLSIPNSTIYHCCEIKVRHRKVQALITKV